MASLYELQNWRAQVQMMIENGEEGLGETLESLECAIEDKLEGYAMIIRNLESDAAAYEAEAKRLNERKTVALNGVKRMKQAIADEMTASGKDKVKTTLFNFSFRNNAPAVHVVDETLIPEIFFKTEKTLKKSELAKTLKEMPVEGAELRATRSLQIH